MPHFSHNTCSVAFGHWKSVRARLEHTIQDYVEACVSLQDALRRSSSATARHERDQVFAGLDSELPLLPAYEKILRNSRSSLSVTRNSSSNLVPINSLPSEIMLTILSLSVCQWIFDDYTFVRGEKLSSATIVSRVCRQWRKLVLGSASFWSLIELSPSGRTNAQGYERATLWVERSQRAALSVSIVRSKGSGVATTSEWDIRELIKFLTPLMSRVRNLRVDATSGPDQNLVQSLVACWVQFGAPGVAKKLEIYGSMGQETLWIPALNPDSPTLARFEAFLSSLNSVRICNTYINMTSLACSRLTDLYLDSITEWDPSLEEIKTILAANPTLRFVAFVDINVVMPSGSPPDPVALDHLETLTLEAADPGDLWSILLLITSTSDSVRLSLSLPDDTRCVSATHDFFSRCRITMLHLRARDSTDFVIFNLLTRIPHMTTLILRDFKMTGETLQEYILQHSFTRHSAALWPSLQDICLVNCSPTTYVLKRLAIFLRSPCELSVCGARAFDGRRETERNKKIQKELLRYDIDLEFISFVYDPANNWSFIYDE
ncbi:F-box-like protein [Ceratobasidium sp. AG-Ba]|nr:F-box-like protein [Ceratobasidium sp. AG-Ba]